MILATEAEFATAYTAYRHHGGYAKRARLLRRFPQPVLVVGCGFGFLVNELERLNIDTWGIDASDYCWANRVTDRFTRHDILAGPPPIPARTIVTESMLEWLTDDEAIIAARNCAATGAIVLHFVTEQGQTGYNYHSTGYWMTLIGQPTISLEGM